MRSLLMRCVVVSTAAIRSLPSHQRHRYMYVGVYARDGMGPVVEEVVRLCSAAERHHAGKSVNLGADGLGDHQGRDELLRLLPHIT